MITFIIIIIIIITSISVRSGAIVGLLFDVVIVDEVVALSIETVDECATRSLFAQRHDEHVAVFDDVHNAEQTCAEEKADGAANAGDQVNYGLARRLGHDRVLELGVVDVEREHRLFELFVCDRLVGLELAANVLALSQQLGKDARGKVGRRHGELVVDRVALERTIG